MNVATVKVTNFSSCVLVRRERKIERGKEKLKKERKEKRKKK